MLSAVFKADMLKLIVSRLFNIQAMPVLIDTANEYTLLTDFQNQLPKGGFVSTGIPHELTPLL